jgi:hypothetical protein
MHEPEEGRPARRRATGEILPPDPRTARPVRRSSHISIVLGRSGTRRVRVTPLHPFAAWVVALVLGVLGMFTLFVIVSTALLWAVGIGALVAVVILVQRIRAYLQRN